MPDPHPLLNPRLAYFYRHGSRCPACGDHEQQQVTDMFISPAKWRCRLCKHRYEHEPEGAPTWKEAWGAIVSEVGAPFEAMASLGSSEDGRR